MIVDITLSEKQLKAHELLTDEFTSELVFGGGARGGKSWLGSVWIISECLAKPESAWLIGREELKALKRTTLRTFLKVLMQKPDNPDPTKRGFGLVSGKDFKFNAQDMIISFANGSIVFLGELKKIPSDPEFDRLGSYDLTGAWIDEAQEVCKDAKDALQFRYTVLSGNGWVTNPKTLYTCNPGKNWIFSDFWKPIVKDKLEVEGKAFITSLFTDNPYIDHEKYKKNVLRTKNKIKIERLLNGNFEYDDDPNKIFEYDPICNLFTNHFVEEGEKYLSCDVAFKGSDLLVGVVWSGFRGRIAFVRKKSSPKEIEQLIKSTAQRYKIPRSNIVYDHDGVGGFLGDYVSGSKSFVNGSRALNEENYLNLKSQCYFKFAEKVNANEVFIECDHEEWREKIKEELDSIKQKNPDSDAPLRIISKDEIKEVLGRSPDFADSLMMRMFFELVEEVYDDCFVV